MLVKRLLEQTSCFQRRAAPALVVRGALRKGLSVGLQPLCVAGQGAAITHRPEHPNLFAVPVSRVSRFWPPHHRELPFYIEVL